MCDRVSNAVQIVKSLEAILLFVILGYINKIDLTCVLMNAVSSLSFVFCFRLPPENAVVMLDSLDIDTVG